MNSDGEIVDLTREIAIPYPYLEVGSDRHHVTVMLCDHSALLLDIRLHLLDLRSVMGCSGGGGSASKRRVTY